ncbi:trypsin-like peptidase domain-containing protein [Candidatus Saccharibacteria bacterium]|nr:trypsin-like peptidase domain-containing protein [Candidatus Saccharibacteria bacterium]
MKERRVRRANKKVLIIASSLLLIAVLLFSGSLIAIGYLMGTTLGDGGVQERQKQTIVSEGEVIADIAQKVGSSVVSVITEQQRTIQSIYGTQSVEGQAAGTGVIVDKSGYVLTNKHVVPEGTNAVKLILSDGSSYEDVEIVGRDPLNDLAILKIQDPADDITPASLGDSDTVRVGQKVVAIGNALGQFQNTVTSGIISGVGRPIEAGDGSGYVEQLSNLFQTDAAINSGNSGGPLLNYDGEVIGINTAVAEDAQNVGFSIPINEAKGIIASAQKTGTVTRPFLGVQFTTITEALAQSQNLPVDTGALISSGEGAIVADSPAAQAGLRPGDIVLKIDNVKLDDRRTLDSVIGRYGVGDTVKLTILRGDKRIVVETKLAEAPSQ